MELFLAFVLIAQVFTMGFLIRNNWVFSTRIRWINTNFHGYQRAVSYNAMMLRWWSWKPNPEDWQQ
jgi:hypothetical protein